MELEVIAIVIVTGLSCSVFGAAIAHRFFPVEVEVPVEVIVLTSRTDAPRLPPDTRHKHEYDHVRGDGEGWRCGLCDKPRPKEDAA